MVNNKRLCIDCNIPMKTTTTIYKRIELEGLECPKCQEKIFTEDLAKKAISKLEARRVEAEYLKNPIKIGHSWGLTFPKEVARFFQLENHKTKLKLHPHPEQNKIEILIS